MFRTTDVALHDQPRPSYWDDDGNPEPDLAFTVLAEDPLPPLRALVSAAEQWGAEHWSSATLDRRAQEERWARGMREQARREAERYTDEVARLANGLRLLETDELGQARLRPGQPSFRRRAVDPAHPLETVPARLRGQQPRVDRGHVP